MLSWSYATTLNGLNFLEDRKQLLLQVAVKVDEGVKQLLKAEKSQKQSGMVLCIMFLVCAVIVMLVVYICKIILLR